jgi:site-specific recombinase XerD
MAHAIPWIESPDAAFRDWLRGTFRYTAGSLHPALNAWSALTSFLTARQRRVVEATTPDLREFLPTLPLGARAGPRAARCRRLLELFELAFEEMRREGLRRDNPVQPLVLEYPPLAHPLRLPLGAAQRAALTRSVHRSAREWRQVRNRAITLLVLAEGLRPAEVAAMRLIDLRAAAGGARLRGTCWSRHTREAVAAWLEHRDTGRLAGECAFPVNECGEPFSPNAVYRLIRALLRRCGVHPRQLGRLDVRDCVSRAAIEKEPARMSDRRRRRRPDRARAGIAAT